MRSPEQQSAPPGRATVQGWRTRFRQFASAAPLPVKAAVVVGICIFAPALVAIALFAALAYAPYALWSGSRSPIATASVAIWGIALVAARTHGLAGPRYLLLLIPPVAAAVSHAGVLGRWAIPCRTTAWTLLWSLPVGAVLTTVRIWRSQPLVGPGTAWLIALVVLGWRTAKALQDSREYARRSGFSGALAAPHALAQAGLAGSRTAGPRTAGAPFGGGWAGSAPAWALVPVRQRHRGVLRLRRLASPVPSAPRGPPSPGAERATSITARSHRPGSRPWSGRRSRSTRR